MGYHRAGFDVVGVDNAPQKHYPFEFIQGDALAPPVDITQFDAIHASPPCQGYSRLRHLPWLKDRNYPLLVKPVWDWCVSTELQFVIENVEDCWEMPHSTVLCGLALGLPMYRHRRFGSSILIMAPPHGRHERPIFPGARLNNRYAHSAGVTGILPSPAGHTSMHGLYDRVRAAMDIDWMTRDELTQAIPPAYTEFIGRQIMDRLRAK
jgi:DNA (cytosine-5)-methyltransferase 1